MNSNFIKFVDRPESSLFGIDEYKSIAHGKYLTKFQTFPMQKDPLTLEIYRSLLEDKQFSTIIEFGSLYGSSAAWMAYHSPKSKILSLDINQEAIKNEFKTISNIDFKHFDAFKHDQLKSLIEDLPKPWLIVEDCHQNVLGLLNTCYPYLCNGDYIIIEDTNPLGPEQPMIDDTPYVPFGNVKLDIAENFGKNEHIYVDSYYCDRFGLNCSNQWNSIFCYNDLVCS